MKSERRHELQQNVLAQWLAEQIEAVKPYWQWIAGVVVLLIAVVILVLFASRHQRTGTSNSWDDYFAAFSEGDLEGLEAVVEDHSNTDAGLWARQAMGDIRLKSGSLQLYTNPDEAERDLNRAVEDYQEVLEAAKQPMLQQRALFGLAQAYESQAKLEPAKEQYQKLAEQWPDSVLGKTAARRSQQLQRPTVKEFYGWFEKQDMTKLPRVQMPEELEPSADLLPGTDLSLPGSDLSLPGSEGLDPPEDDKSTDEPSDDAAEKKPDDAATDDTDESAEKKPDDATTEEKDDAAEEKPDDKKEDEEPAKKAGDTSDSSKAGEYAPAVLI